MSMQVSKEHFQIYKLRYEVIALSLYFLINASIDATTVLMEDARTSQASFAFWEPFVWEYSSAFSTLLLIPLIAWFMRQFPYDWQAIQYSLIKYIGAAFLYSALHILLMIITRELYYGLSSLEYDFATSLREWLFEGLYELRKDLWSFCFFVVMIGVYRHLISQYLGDVSSLNERANLDILPNINESESLAKLLLVKKLGKEFLVKTQDIEWVEACGNYCNLHLGNELYPMRITMSELTLKSESYGLVRAHKSFLVNINHINFIEPTISGDAVIVLRSGKRIKLSRRFKAQFDSYLR